MYRFVHMLEDSLAIMVDFDTKDEVLTYIHKNYESQDFWSCVNGDNGSPIFLFKDIGGNNYGPVDFSSPVSTTFVDIEERLY